MGDEQVLRSRLLTQLADRFDVRVTTVVASAGFGKTTLLAQAVEQNRLSPRGLDVWLGCSADDDPDSLAVALLTSMGADTTPHPIGPAAGVADAVWAMAPTDVVLIFDDAHLVLENEEGRSFLTDLIGRLPKNGHLLLSTRDAVALPMSRLRAAGDVIEIDQPALAFDPAEIDEFGDRFGNLDDDSPALRWPALARLVAKSGVEAAAEFVWEEVLADLDPAKREALAKLAPFPFVDDGLVAAATEWPGRADDLLDGLPLVDHARAGEHRLHALWRPILDAAISEDERIVALKRGADHLLDRSELAAAAEAFALAGDVDGLVRTAVGLCARPLTNQSVDEARRVLLLITEADVSPALAKAVEAVIELGKSEPTAQQSLEASAAMLAESGDAALEVQVLFLASQLAGLAEGFPPGPHLLPRATELAASSDDSVAAIANAMVARYEICERLMAGDVPAAFDRVQELSAFGPVRGRMLIEQVIIDAGWPEKVDELGAGGLEEVTRSGDIEMQASYALWVRGIVSPEVGLELASGMVSLVTNRRLSHQSILLRGVVAIIAVAAGRVDLARAHITHARGLASPVLGPRLLGYLDISEACVALHEGDEEEAARIFDELVEAVPMEGFPPRIYMHTLAPLYILVPSVRPLLDTIDIGPSLRVVLDAAKALVEFRETGTTDAATQVQWSTPELLRANIWPAHLVELALAAREGGEAGGEQILEAIVDQRLILEHLVAADGKVKQAAVDALNSLPIGPGYTLRVRALGQMALYRDGDEVLDPDWHRREKVRLLFAYLLQHPSVSRRDLAAALWPDLEIDKALANVRANLRFLLRAMEPERPTGTDSWFIDTDGRTIDLLLDRIELDVVDFDALVEQGRKADERGVPSETLDCYERAIALYDGDYLEESFQDPWAEFERIRLRSAAALAGARVAELLLARGEPEASIRRATWALGREPLLERAHRARMRALLATDDRNAARRAGLLLMDQLDEINMAPEHDTLTMLSTLGIRVGAVGAVAEADGEGDAPAS